MSSCLITQWPHVISRNTLTTSRLNGVLYWLVFFQRYNFHSASVDICVWKLQPPKIRPLQATTGPWHLDSGGPRLLVNSQAHNHLEKHPVAQSLYLPTALSALYANIGFFSYLCSLARRFCCIRQIHLSLCAWWHLYFQGYIVHLVMCKS